MADTAAWWGVGIAAVSLIISILAFIASKTSAEAARQANNFQLHTYQKEIYAAYCIFESEVRARGLKLDRAVVDQFEPYAESSRLYFSNEINEKIKDYFETCQELVRRVEANETKMRSLLNQGHLAEQSNMDALADGYESMRHLTRVTSKTGPKVKENIKDAITIVYIEKSLWHKYIEELTAPYDWDDKGEPQ